MAKPQTSEERHRAFNALFETVKADGEGTAMGSLDKDRNQAFEGVTFDKMPKTSQEYQLPDVTPKPEAPEEKPRVAPGQPLKIDEKTKKFYQVFDHVTDAQATQYGGQATALNKDVDFGQMPEPSREQTLPEPKMPQRDFLQEDSEARQRGAVPEGKHSQRYDKAHEAFVKTFGDSTKD